MESLLANVLKRLSVNPVPFPKPDGLGGSDRWHLCQLRRAFDSVPQTQNKQVSASQLGGGHICFRIFSAAQPQLGTPQKRV